MRAPSGTVSEVRANGLPIAAALVAWYDRHARRLPWRVGPRERARGERPDPYRVWLSEVMLQQTTVAAVKPYFEAFVANWPTVADLAAAAEEDVMKAWAGLGYYRRARNLKAAAAAIAAMGGGFPETAAALARLPGVGVYTAAAVAAIAFDEPAAVVDGNIERVIARLFAVETPLPQAKAELRAIQERLTPRDRAGDYAQAMMDLGAAICTPKRPACALCPINAGCLAFERGTQERHPLKATKAERPTRIGAAYVAIRADGAVLLRRRPPIGLLGSMTEVPGSEWTAKAPHGTADRAAGAPFRSAWRRVATPVVHVFTHFRLELTVHRADMAAATVAPAGHWWSLPADLPSEALPSVMKKAIEAAAPGATKRNARSGR